MTGTAPAVAAALAAAADAVGRGTAGGLPPAAAAELEDPLAAVPFFTILAVASWFLGLSVWRLGAAMASK